MRNDRHLLGQMAVATPGAGSASPATATEFPAAQPPVYVTAGDHGCDSRNLRSSYELQCSVSWVQTRATFHEMMMNN